VYFRSSKAEVKLIPEKSDPLPNNADTPIKVEETGANLSEDIW
jgi:hypothetical protein